MSTDDLCIKSLNETIVLTFVRLIDICNIKSDYLRAVMITVLKKLSKFYSRPLHYRRSRDWRKIAVFEKRRHGKNGGKLKGKIARGKGSDI